MKSGWTIKCLGEITEVLDSLRKPVTKSDRKSGPYPYYGASGVQDFVDSYLFDGRYLLVGEDGAKWGAGDKSAYIIEGKSWVNNHAHILKVRNSISDKYLEYYLVFSDLNEYITGAVVPKLTQKALCTIPIPIPPIEEQQRIVDELDLLTDILDKKNAQLRDLDAYAQSLFYEMFGDPVINDKGWPQKKLNTVCDVRDGTHDSPKYLTYSDYILVTSKNIVGDSIDYSNINYISKEDYDAINKRSKVDEGDIIMAMIGTIGKPVIVHKEGYNFCVKNVALIKFQANSEVTNVYIRALLNSPSYSDYILSLNKGGTQKFVALGTLRSLPIPVPPMHVLEDFSIRISSIEKQSHLIRESIAELNQLLSCKMSQLFTQG